MSVSNREESWDAVQQSVRSPCERMTLMASDEGIELKSPHYAMFDMNEM